MNDTEREIFFRLFKKGKENLTDFDKLLIESNHRIKKRVIQFSEVPDTTYQKTLKRTEEKTALKKRKVEKTNRLFRFVSIPAAACFLIFFTFILQHTTSVVALGGKSSKVTLLVSKIKKPGIICQKGGFFNKGEQLQLAFQPDGDLKNIDQGILFSVDSNLDSSIYYRYDKTSGPLKHSSSTQIEQVVKLEKDIDFIYFFIVLSGTAFNEEELITRVKKIIESKQLKSEDSLEKEFKDKECSYIYLIQEEK